MFGMKVFLFLLIVVYTPNTLVFGKPTYPSDPANFINAKVSGVGQHSIQHVKVIFLTSLRPSPVQSPSPLKSDSIKKWEFGLWAVTQILWVTHPPYYASDTSSEYPLVHKILA